LQKTFVADMKDAVLYSDKFVNSKFRPSLSNFGGKAIDGFVAVTASGYVSWLSLISMLWTAKMCWILYWWPYNVSGTTHPCFHCVMWTYTPLSHYQPSYNSLQTFYHWQPSLCHTPSTDKRTHTQQTNGHVHCVHLSVRWNLRLWSYSR